MYISSGHIGKCGRAGHFGGLRQIGCCISARPPFPLAGRGLAEVRLPARRSDVMPCDRLRPRWAPRAPPCPTPQAPPPSPLPLSHHWAEDLTLPPQ